MHYETVVGNVGMVYAGCSLETATARFDTYVHLSKAGYGSVARESVVLLANDEIVKEYIGEIDRGE